MCQELSVSHQTNIVPQEQVSRYHRPQWWSALRQQLQPLLKALLLLLQPSHLEPCAMFDEEMSLGTIDPTLRQPGVVTISNQRLEKARARIETVCAERNFFNPSWYFTRRSSICTMHTGMMYGKFLRLWDPEQLKADLQALFERVRTLESVEADEVYEQISVKIRDKANDEYGQFDWHVFKDSIGNGTVELSEHDYFVEFSDLATLRTAAEFC
jgi:hypothetical protein